MSNDARIAVLETIIISINSTLLDIKQDMKRSFEKIDSKFETMDSKFDSKFETMDSKFDSKFEAMDNKFEALEKKFDSKFETMDNKFEALEKKFDSKFDTLQNRLWSNFLWIMGMFVGLTGLIAHTQHWI